MYNSYRVMQMHALCFQANLSFQFSRFLLKVPLKLKSVQALRQFNQEEFFKDVGLEKNMYNCYCFVQSSLHV